MWLLLFAACSHEPATYGPYDARVDLPPPAEGVHRFTSSEQRIPAGEERQFCTFFTWDGGDVGIAAAQSYQDGLYGHHAVLLTTIVSDYQQPDGSTMDCTSADDLSMAQTDVLYVPKPIAAGSTGMTLPDGVAVKLEQGTRLVLQSHYINWSDTPILVQDVVDLTVMAPEDVQTWAAAFAHTTIDLDLPPGESSYQVDCQWESDVTLLYVMGHMHELGTSFSVDWVHGDETSRVYDIPNWYASYRDAPPIRDESDGVISVQAGDRFVTTCAWDNDTGANVRFPQEMCVTAGIAYPSEERLYCAEL